MLAEPMTLYKLMNLYMLHQVNFPLTNAQLSNFFLDREYTTYFTLQQALNSFPTQVCKKETMRNSSCQRSLRRARKRWNFSAKTSSCHRQRHDEYSATNRFRMRNEVD